jgi:hypothetical protein
LTVFPKAMKVIPCLRKRAELQSELAISRSCNLVQRRQIPLIQFPFFLMPRAAASARKREDSNERH